MKANSLSPLSMSRFVSGADKTFTKLLSVMQAITISQVTTVTNINKDLDQHI